ncbi:MAG: bifunctional rhamnulose-1-phosphate aldolase/short-chain dehydrogenase [Bryobacteraceae bacterium]
MLQFLKDLWDPSVATSLEADGLALLTYRSNLLGADLRITNFGGGNTSSKLALPDPFTRKDTQVLAVKGSGGDLGSIKKTGFALLYMDRLNDLRGIYRGEAHEDEMVGYYPLAAFGDSRVAASIDTPLHGFLPYPHVDHLHPDWAIAIAAAANGKEKLDEFNAKYGHKVVWLPWQRPGFELGLMLAKAVTDNPDCDGILLGSHGLFTWGGTQRDCYINSVRMIDDMGKFLNEHEQRLSGPAFGGAKYSQSPKAQSLAAAIFPYLRGAVGQSRRSVGHYNDSGDVQEFANSQRAEELARLGTSCPDHFLRTKISPLYVDWNPETEDIPALQAKLDAGLAAYRESYKAYHAAFAEPDSPAVRDPNPSVVLIPGIGMFTFGKNKPEARISGEFYVNAIHVMAGAIALGNGAAPPAVLPQAKNAEDSKAFSSLHNYVALPQREAFRIEYWALEEAKLRRMPPEQEFSRRIVLVVGGGAGIGRNTALDLARGGANVMIADKNEEAARAVAVEAAQLTSKEAVASCYIDLTDRKSIDDAIDRAVLAFGGLDGVVNTAAVFIAPDLNGKLTDEKWALTLSVNVTGNHFLLDEAAIVLRQQNLPSTIVLTSSANAVVPKRGSEAYDVSKSAVNHMVREYAIDLSPRIRVNAIAPATVVEGSTMFPRDRVMASLAKYKIAFEESESTDELRHKLAQFYAQRTLTKLPITPADCAQAILYLTSDRSAKTTGHVIPVDGGLPEAFLR